MSIYLGSLTGWRVLLRVGENPRGLDFRILVALGLEHVPGQDITHLWLDSYNLIQFTYIYFMYLVQRLLLLCPFTIHILSLIEIENDYKDSVTISIRDLEKLIFSHYIYQKLTFIRSRNLYGSVTISIKELE